MKANYLICYDIRHQRRLARVLRCMKKMGLHIQYSVFFSRLTKDELALLKSELLDIIDDEEDDIRIYSLPSDLNITVIGRGDRIPEGVSIFLR